MLHIHVDKSTTHIRKILYQSSNKKKFNNNFQNVSIFHTLIISAKYTFAQSVL